MHRRLRALAFRRVVFASPALANHGRCTKGAAVSALAPNPRQGYAKLRGACEGGAQASGKTKNPRCLRNSGIVAYLRHFPRLVKPSIEAHRNDVLHAANQELVAVPPEP